ncbi:MAG: hypothetical protein CM15mV33_400 [uncultured marine virus]|nr:MAG: hypothetical protein CM15mV33_400 [uncultured marine virus]
MAIINTIKITTSKVVKLVWSRTVNGVDLYSYSPETVDYIYKNVPSICLPDEIELPLFMMPTENDWDSLRTFFEEYLCLGQSMLNFSHREILKSRSATISNIADSNSRSMNVSFHEIISVPPRDDWRNLPVGYFMFALRCAVTDDKNNPRSVSESIGDSISPKCFRSRPVPVTRVPGLILISRSCNNHETFRCECTWKRTRRASRVPLQRVNPG